MSRYYLFLIFFLACFCSSGQRNQVTDEVVITEKFKYVDTIEIWDSTITFFAVFALKSNHKKTFETNVKSIKDSGLVLINSNSNTKKIKGNNVKSIKVPKVDSNNVLILKLIKTNLENLKYNSIDEIRRERSYSLHLSSHSVIVFEASNCYSMTVRSTLFSNDVYDLSIDYQSNGYPLGSHIIYTSFSHIRMNQTYAFPYTGALVHRLIIFGRNPHSVMVTVVN